MLSAHDQGPGVGEKVEQYLPEKYADNMENHFCVYQNRKFRFRKVSRAK